MDSAKLMIEKGATNLKYYFSYLGNEQKLIQLLEMGLNPKKLEKIWSRGIKSIEQLKEKKIKVHAVLDDYLIKDIINIINDSYIY